MDIEYLLISFVISVDNEYLPIIFIASVDNEHLIIINFNINSRKKLVRYQTVIMPKKQRNAYDSNFKLKVLSYAEQHSNAAAEREYGVNEKLVRDWRKKKTELLSLDRPLKKMRRNPSPLEALEKDLLNWVTELRQQGYIVTRGAIRVQALQRVKEDKTIAHKDFKASAGWCTRFMNRHGLAIRQRTHIAQKLPTDVEKKVENFHRFVLKHRRLHNFPLAAIGNMDETPISFDLPSNRTVHFKGEKTVSVKTTGAEKSYMTVVLSCMADRTKLKPMVVFKRKTMPKEKLPAGVLVYVNEKGWMNEDLCNVWLEKVWSTRPGALINRKSLLVWDMFRGHLGDKVKRTLKSMKVTQAVIPGGCTSVLQPLDVSLNKPFKTKMRELWTNWMINREKEFTAGGNLKRPSYSVIIGWIKEAWDSVSTDIVCHSFKKCGISNNMDGSEDDALYSDLVSGPDSADSESETMVPEEPANMDSDDDFYDDIPLSELQMKLLFEDNGDEEFLGFTPEDIRE